MGNMGNTFEWLTIIVRKLFLDVYAILWMNIDIRHIDIDIDIIIFFPTQTNRNASYISKIYINTNFVGWPSE